MLAMFGPVMFDLKVNLYETSEESEARFAEKPVLGVRPPLEFIGAGGHSFQLTVKLFPEKLGGLSSVDALRAVQESGLPQYFMRGDGVPQGWFVLDRLSVKSTFLGPNGVGRVVDVDISIKRAGAPTGSDFFASIAGILS